MYKLSAKGNRNSKLVFLVYHNLKKYRTRFFLISQLFPVSKADVSEPKTTKHRTASFTFLKFIFWAFHFFFQRIFNSFIATAWLINLIVIVLYIFLSENKWKLLFHFLTMTICLGIFFLLSLGPTQNFVTSPKRVIYCGANWKTVRGWHLDVCWTLCTDCPGVLEQRSQKWIFDTLHIGVQTCMPYGI